ncbi:hypothetical protein ABE527_04970 [Brucella sp. TWI432]
MTLIDRLSKLEGPDMEITEREGYIHELSKGTQYGFENDAAAISYHMGRIALLRAKEAS